MKILNHEQGSKPWHDARRNRITGTKLEKVMGTPKVRAGLITCLLGEEGTEMTKPQKQTPEMERGSAEEAFARKAFEKKYGKKVKEVGVCISDELDWLAYSPDGLIETKKGVYSEGVEIKNPDSATMISYRLGVDRSDIGVPEDYKWQIVDAFLVNEKLEKMYFVAYDARFIEDEHKMYVVEVERSNPALLGALEEARKRLAEFRAEWMRCRDIVLPSNF